MCDLDKTPRDCEIALTAAQSQNEQDQLNTLKMKEDQLLSAREGAVKFQLARRYDLAEDKYREALKLDLEDQATWFNYAYLLECSKKYDQAEQAYKRACHLGPKEGKILKQYGLFLQKIGNLEEAEKICKRSLEVNDRCYSSLVLYGDILETKSSYHEAMEMYQKALKIEPNSAPAMGKCARMYHLYLDNPVDAEKMYKKSISINDRNSTVLNNYSTFLFEQNRRDEAKKMLSKAIKWGPSVTSKENLELMKKISKKIAKMEKRTKTKRCM